MLENSAEILNEKQTATELGVKVATLRIWSARRKGPPRIKVGRKLFYRRETLLAWLASREGVYGAQDKKPKHKLRSTRK
jgi:hypothetical protein